LRVYRIQWIRHSVRIIKAISEGKVVYSRDMGRGNSREKGGGS